VIDDDFCVKTLLSAASQETEHTRSKMFAFLLILFTCSVAQCYAKVRDVFAGSPDISSFIMQMTNCNYRHDKVKIKGHHPLVRN